MAKNHRRERGWGVEMVEAKAGGQTWLLGLNGGVRVDRSEELLRRLALPFLFH